MASLHIPSTLAVLSMVLGCVFVMQNQNAAVTNWPFGGPEWKFWVGHILAWGGFFYIGWSVAF